MNKDSVFSPEYDIGNATETASSLPKQVSTLEESENLVDKIQLDYKLSKPRRKLIHAKVIQ